MTHNLSSVQCINLEFGANVCYSQVLKALKFHKNSFYRNTVI